MPDLGAPDYQVARFLLERGLAAIYLVAFVVALRQFPALCGERGLEPAPRFLQVLPRFLSAPTVFRWIGYSDAKLRALSGTGSAIAVAMLLGLPQAAALPLTMLFLVALLIFGVPFWVGLGLGTVALLLSTGALPLTLVGEALFEGVDG